MPEEISKKVNEEIVKRFRRDRRAQYLAELLSISRESACRRLRGTISYSLEDVSRIANDLNISIDRILGNLNGIDCSIFNKLNSKPEDFYADMLMRNAGTIENAVSVGKASVTAALNRIPMYFLPSEILCKLEYFLYLHATHNFSLNDNFSSIYFPQKIVEMHDRFLTAISKLDSITCIIHSDVFSNITKKIKYYHQLLFLSDDDVIILQNELYRLLGKFGELLLTGKSKSGADCLFYYSLLDIESNTVLIENKYNSILQLWIYPERSPIVIQNYPLICDMQKSWISFSMRNSVPVTKTNELKQSEMLRGCHKLIKELREEN
jgi:transcriptional regulator with XRE-family HTH domain